MSMTTTRLVEVKQGGALVHGVLQRIIEDENEDHNYVHKKESLIIIDTSHARARFMIRLINNTQSFVFKAVSLDDEPDRLMENLNGRTRSSLLLQALNLMKERLWSGW